MIAAFDLCCQTGDGIPVKYSRLLSVLRVVKQVTAFMWIVTVAVCCMQYSCHDCYL